jgi:hypothetical protein
VRARLLGDLADTLAVRFRATSDRTALDEALAARREVVAVTPPDHADRQHRMRALAATRRQVDAAG